MPNIVSEMKKNIENMSNEELNLALKEVESNISDLYKQIEEIEDGLNEGKLRKQQIKNARLNKELSPEDAHLEKQELEKILKEGEKAKQKVQKDLDNHLKVKKHIERKLMQ